MKQRGPCSYCDWRDLLSSKETILLLIHGAHTGISVAAMFEKLSRMGVWFKPAENELRARLSELRSQAMVREGWRGGQVWQLTSRGELEVAEITPQLRDGELEEFAK